MCNAISLPVIYSLLVLLGVACGRSDPDSAGPANKAPHLAATGSYVFFESAEQQLAERHYVLAARHLDKGIIAFRIETGKMSGMRAARANRAIDNLTRLRKTLRQGEAVNAHELHQAILTAMESEPEWPVSTYPKPGSGLGVPVGGH